MSSPIDPCPSACHTLSISLKLMDIWFNIPRKIDEMVRRAAERLPGFDKEFDPGIQIADPRFGDFQANGVLPYAKHKRINPRKAANDLSEALRGVGGLDPDLLSWNVAGPGFLNFQLSPLFLQQWLEQFYSERTLKEGASEFRGGERVVVDFSSPNSAKQLHVGHIRSTVIGEAICRTLEFCGVEVTRDNHIGDFGTQFGILILAIKRRNWKMRQLHEASLATIEDLYKEGNALTNRDAQALEKARHERVKLQRNDSRNVEIWKCINAISCQSFEKIYEQLDVHFDVVLPESFYRNKVEQVYREFTEFRIAQVSDGALVAFHPEHARFKEQPFIIRNSDGASNYATTDLATILYRSENFQPHEIIYVVDSRQSDHFEQLFLTCRKWFRARKTPLPQLHHVSFGTILGENGKPFKTREGEPPNLQHLLDEATRRAYDIVTKKSPALSEMERREVAEVVGVNAIRYADLMQNRTSDYLFSWRKMLSLEGNTAPYLLYAVARIHSIFSKAKTDPDHLPSASSPFATESEVALARKLVAFATSLSQTVRDLRPHYLCTYLYELAGIFSSFYYSDKVIVDESETRNRRLMLCARTLLVLTTGLKLLGIRTLKRM